MTDKETPEKKEVKPKAKSPTPKLRDMVTFVDHLGAEVPAVVVWVGSGDVVNLQAFMNHHGVNFYENVVYDADGTPGTWHD
jgi:hypothetical protein